MLYIYVLSYLLGLTKNLLQIWCCSQPTKIFPSHFQKLSPRPSHTPDGNTRWPAWTMHGYEGWIEILLMEEIRQQFISSLSMFIPVFIHPRWCMISSTNSKTPWDHWQTHSSDMSLICHWYCNWLDGENYLELGFEVVWLIQSCSKCN